MASPPRVGVASFEERPFIPVVPLILVAFAQCVVEISCLHVLHGHKRPFVANRVSQKSHNVLGSCFLQDGNLLQDLALLVPALDHLDGCILPVDLAWGIAADSRGALSMVLRDQNNQDFNVLCPQDCQDQSRALSTCAQKHTQTVCNAKYVWNGLRNSFESSSSSMKMLTIWSNAWDGFGFHPGSALAADLVALLGTAKQGSLLKERLPNSTTPNPPLPSSIGLPSMQCSLI